MKKQYWHWTVLTLLVFLLARGSMAHAYGGGGEREEPEEPTGSVSGQSGNDAPSPSGGGGGGGGEGFGASPKAVAAWEAAGGRKGTGMSFQDWFKKQRIEWDKQQHALTWDAKKAGWGASAWSIPFWGAQAANAAGKTTQTMLSFVPGMGWVSVSLDTARGAAEGYGEAIDKGLSQADAAKVGTKTGIAQGLTSAVFNKIGAGNKLNYDKAVKSVQTARTAKQMVRANKNLKKAILGTIADETVQEVVGNQHVSQTVKDSSPAAQTYK